MRPLLLSQAPTRLLNCIRATSNSRRLSASDRVRLLSALLRALRNVLVATADLVWGYMRGVSLRRRVVDTGLAGPGESRVSEAGDTGGGATAAKKAKGKEVDRGPGGGGGKEMAAGVLSMVFEVSGPLASVFDKHLTMAEREPRHAPRSPGLLDKSSNHATAIPTPSPAHRPPLTPRSPR